MLKQAFDRNSDRGYDDLYIRCQWETWADLTRLEFKAWVESFAPPALLG
jgi:hypothetical protein